VLDQERAIPRHPCDHDAQRMHDPGIPKARDQDATLDRANQRLAVRRSAPRNIFSGSGPKELGAGSECPVDCLPSLPAVYES